MLSDRFEMRIMCLTPNNFSTNITASCSRQYGLPDAIHVQESFLHALLTGLQEYCGGDIVAALPPQTHDCLGKQGLPCVHLGKQGEL